MTRKALNQRSKSRGKKGKMKGSLASHLTAQLGQYSLFSFQQQSEPSPIHNLIEAEVQAAPQSSSPLDFDFNPTADDKEFILSQDIFCTPDYITPDAPPISKDLDYNKENVPCPRSPEKIKSVKSKRLRPDDLSVNSILSSLSCHQEEIDLAIDTLVTDENKLEKIVESKKNRSYVSQSAVALRCRVLPPPCIKNPYLRDESEVDADPLGNRRSKCAGYLSSVIGGDGLSRYRTDFHEIEQIGYGNFSRVFKVLKRIDGCMYAVKHTIKKLHQDTERQKALMEVQALAALGSHENIVGYYSSWLENEQLYIQMELCDHSLSVNSSSKLYTEGEALEVLHQISKGLQFIHERGMAHLDVKPDNIYVRNGICKLGDFGCATLLDRSLPIDEGDARYMPHEILNDKYDHLDKVDIFSLGAAIYELVKGTVLPESGPQFLNLREGKLPLLPGHSMQFQNLLKVMMDPDPVRRPSAKELVENPIFDRPPRTVKSK